MSRIELDDKDRRIVERARELLAESEPEARPTEEAAYQAWKVDQVGKLLAAVDMLLEVIGQGGEAS